MAAQALLKGGETAMALAEYMSDEDGAAFRAFGADFPDESDREFVMEQVMRQMIASEKFSSLAEIHPAWILEKLKEEPPKVIGIILRYLPSNHVRYIIRNLPPMTRVQIPNMVESFAVRPAVLEVIRKRFERHFLPMPVSRRCGKFGFSELYYLKGEELAALIREMGINELAIAFAGMGSKALRAIYNRLDLKDAKRLQRRLKGLKGLSLELSRQARYTVLEVQGRHIGPEGLLVRVGLAALANAVEGGDALIPVLMQKLTPEDSYLLKRLVAERRMRQWAGVALERQSMILSIVAQLARESRIDSSWSSFDPEELAPIPVTGVSTNSAESDETITSQQLA